MCFSTETKRSMRWLVAIDNFRKEKAGEGRSAWRTNMPFATAK